MKKLILIPLLVFGAFYGFGQATPSGQLRVAHDTTQFDQNISVGTTLFVLEGGATADDSLFYISIKPVARTFNRSTSPDKWILIGGGTVSRTTSAFYIVEEFEEGAAAAKGQTNCLFGVPIPTTVFVELNGMGLKTAEYSLVGQGSGNSQCADAGSGKLHTLIPVYQYDRIKVSYRYLITSTGTPR